MLVSFKSIIRTTATAAAVGLMLSACGGGDAQAPPADNPVPSISTLSPSSVATGADAFTLTVSGSDFIASSVVNWNDAALTTTFVSASTLTALVPASDLGSAGTANITVVSPSPGGGTSSASTFTINASNPVPAISSLSPSSVAAGADAFTLTVKGNFVASSVVDWNGAALTTTFVSASMLTALVPAADLGTVGTANITVTSPSPGGGTSNTSTFTINASNPLPAISALSPSSVAVGASAFTLTVNGSNFVASSVIDWNGAALATTFVNAAALTALVPASKLGTAGTANITVVNPSPDGGTSHASTFTINTSNPLPAISSLSPASVAAGAGAFTLTVNGSDFVPASVVNWNGAVLTTTFVSASVLTALVPASDLGTAGTANVTVTSPSPGGGASGASTFTINATATPYIRQSAQYNAYTVSHGNTSNQWTVTLSNVLAGSTIYVVGTWPNFYSAYPSMQVTDGVNTYQLLNRYDDKTGLPTGIQGSQSLGHWYAANVPAGTYTINMSPVPETTEDYAALVAFEVAGVASSALDGHALSFQAAIAPRTDALTATMTSSNANGILIAVTFDDLDATAPTVPLVGSGFTDAGQLWDFFGKGNYSARAEFAILATAGSHSALFSPQEAASQGAYPDYMTATIFLDSAP